MCEAKKSKNENISLLSCGFMSGILQAIMFNPWDRALYLSIKDDRPFLHPKNFENPMQGMMQTLFQRALSSGLYFPLEDIFHTQLIKTFGSQKEYRSLQNFCAGTLAGMVNALVLNPSSSVKYHYWGKTDCGNENFFSTSLDMFRKGGVRPFFVGSSATLSRDIIFGGTYALMRHELHIYFLPSYLTPHTTTTTSKSIQSTSSSSSVSLQSTNTINHMNKLAKRKNETIRFLINMFSACMATIFSSPFNYIRNVHYATPPDIKPMSTIHILKDLIYHMKLEYGLKNRISYVTTRLRIGWGTARVGVGMAFGSEFYHYCSQYTTTASTS